MGRMIAGWLGQTRGKVGNTILSNWKGIQTMRAYAVPANPNTAGQQAQRTKFAVMVSLAQNLLGTLITTFLNPFAVEMSGFNYFIKLFSPNATSTGLATSSCQITKGTLEGVSSLSAEYTTGTGSTSVGYASTISGNGLATDDFNCLVLDDATNDVIHYETGASTRSVGSAAISLPTGLLASDLIVYGWFSRGVGSEFVVSNSAGADAVAP